MSTDISRRRLLQSTAAAGTAVGLAGCSSANPLSSGDSACSTGEDFIRAMADEDSEALADMSPYEYVEGEDREDFVEAYDFMFQFLTMDTLDIDDVSCECSESVEPAVVEDGDEEFTVDISDVKELRYDVTMEGGGMSHPEFEYLYAIEIDGTWYAMLADEEDMEHC